MKAQGQLQVRETATFGKGKWKTRFCRVEDEKMQLFATETDSKPKATLETMKVNDVCKSAVVEPRVRPPCHLCQPSLLGFEYFWPFVFDLFLRHFSAFGAALSACLFRLIDLDSLIQFAFEFTIAGKLHMFAAESAELRTRFMAVLVQNGALPRPDVADKEITLSGNGLTEWPKSLLYKLDAEKINLSENQLTVLPDEVCCYERLESLNVSFNQIKLLPASLELIAPQLRELNLTKNALVSLPDLSKSTNLQLLWIGQNKLQTAPKWLPNLVSLQRLSLASNPWTELPDISALVNLRWLDISGCKLSSLPETLKNLSNLQVLEAFSNVITDVPDWLASLSKLTELRLQRNKIAAIPASLSNMPALSEFDISHNSLTTLPKWIADAKFFIECHNNPFDAIPRQVVLAGSQSIRQYIRDNL